MTDFFDGLEDQLTRAAHARARRRVRIPRWIRGLPALAAAGVAVVILVLALTLLHHGHPAARAAGGGIPREPQRAVITYLRDAVRHERPCRAERGPALPATSDGSPGPALLSLLGVLRRPTTEVDRLPRSLQTGADAEGVYVRYIRLARVSDGISYYILPAESINQRESVPLRCYTALISAVRAEMPRIPARFRTATLDFAERLASRDRQLTKTPTGPGVCLLLSGKVGSAGTCGATAPQLESVGLLSFGGPVSGVVPDGVATVTLHYPNGGGTHAKTVTARVVGNVFVSATFASSRLPSPTMVWRAANGTVVRTVPADARHSGSAGFCSGPPRNHGRSSFC